MSTALAKLAETTGVSETEISEVIRGMIISSKAQHGAIATNAEMTVVAGICGKYGLNPMMREAHAFISNGKLQVIIGIDGWIKILNRQPDFDGFEQIDNFNEKGDLISVTTKIYVKGRKYPTPHTEYLDECYQPNSPAWKKYKCRMLTNKSLGQTIRIAFGISEVIDDDERNRITGNTPKERDITPEKQQFKVDFDAIESSFSECADLDTLKSAASMVREELQSNNEWEYAKDRVVAIHIKHKDRIESLTSAEETQFEEVIEQGDNDSIDVEFEEIVEE